MIDKTKLMQLDKKALIKYIKVSNTKYSQKQLKYLTKDVLSDILMTQLSKMNNLPTGKFNQRLKKESLLALPRNVSDLVLKKMEELNKQQIKNHEMKIAHLASKVKNRDAFPIKPDPRIIIYLLKRGSPHARLDKILLTSRGVNVDMFLYLRAIGNINEAPSLEEENLLEEMRKFRKKLKASKHTPTLKNRRENIASIPKV